MSALELKLRITADGKVVVVETERVKKGLREVGEEADKAGRRAKEAFDGRGFTGFLQGLDGMGAALRGIAGIGATLYVAGKIRDIGAAAIDAQVQLDKMANSLRFAMGGDAAKGAREMEYVRETAQKMGLALVDSASAYAKLAASARGTRLEGQQTREIFEAIAGAGTVMGLSVQEQSGALLAVSQMMSKGTVHAEELRGQLGERMPGAFNIAARAMGVTTAELSKMLEQGQVISEEFLPRFAAQLKKELGGEVAQAAKSTQAELNRFGSSWDNLKQQVAQSGVAEFVTGQLAILRDGFDDMSRSIERARKEGDGFWGQMGAAAGAVARFASPTNAFGYQSQAPFAAEAEQLQSLAMQRQNILALGDHPSIDNPRLREIDRQIKALQDKIQKAALKAEVDKKYEGQWIGDSRDPQMASDGRREKAEADEKRLGDALLKLKAEYGDKAARWEREHAELVAALKGASDAQILEAERLLREKIYGPEAKQKAEAYYREGIALAEGEQRFLDSARQAQSEGLKASLEADLISQRQYFERLAEWERYYLDEKKRSVQEQLAIATAAAAKDPAKAADVARYKAELEQLAAEEVRIAERRNVSIAKLEEKQQEELLAIRRETHQQELSAADAFVADFQKKYSGPLRQALIDGNQEIAAALMELYRTGLGRSQFADAKRQFDTIFAAFKGKLEDVKQQGEAMGGLMGALQAGEAAYEIRQQFLPALETTIAKMRELARDNPALTNLVEEATREVNRASQESIAVWSNAVGGFVDLWREGMGRAMDGGMPAIKAWVKSVQQTLKVGIGQFLAELFARRYVLNVVASLAGAVGLGGLQAAAQQAAGGGVNLFGMPTGNLGSEALGWAGSGIASVGTSLFGAGSAMTGVGLGINSAASMGMGNAFMAGAANLASGATSMSLAIGQMLPMIGTVVAVGALLAQLFKDKENPNFRIRYGQEGGAATPFGQLGFEGNYDAQGMPQVLQFVNGFDARLARLLTPEQRAGAAGRLATYDAAGRRADGQPAQFAFPEGDATAMEQIAIEILKGRFGTIFEEIDPRAAAGIRGFSGDSAALQKYIESLIAMQEVVVQAGGRLDWFTGLMADFAGQSEQVQAAAGQVLGYLATDIQEIFEEAANAPRTAYESWSQLSDSIRGWTDLSAEGMVELGNLTQQRYQAELTLVRQITDAIEQTDRMFDDTIRSITLQTLDTPERYDFIKAETDALMAQIGVTSDPEMLMQMSQQLNANLAELFGMLDPAEQRARLGEYTTYLDAARAQVQDRLAVARQQIETERNTALAESVASALERHLKDFAEKQRAAAETNQTAADTNLDAANINLQAANTPQRIELVGAGAPETGA